MIQKTNKIVYIANEFCKSDDDFYKTFVDVYEGAIDFPIIEIHSKRTVIIE